MNTLKLITFIFFCSFGTLRSQSPAATNKIGAEQFPVGSVQVMENNAFKAKLEKDYYAAMRYNALRMQIDTTADALKGYGEAALAYSAFESADSAYQQLYRLFPGQMDAETVLNFADAKYHLGNYEEAELLYHIVADNLNAQTPIHANRAQKGVERCEWVLGQLNQSDKSYIIEKLGDHINTGFSDFGPFTKGDTLYYSSYSTPFTKDKAKPQRYLINVKGNASINSDVQQPSFLMDFNEKEQHTAHTAFNRSGNTMYYTICDFISTAEISCKLYMRLKKNDGTWGPAIKLPSFINNEGATSTEPNVGWDNNSSQEILYFSSDRQGSKGMRDIWSSNILEGGQFSEPNNLSSINTEGDEVTPFYHTNSQTLFFSSDGHKSLGGKDIFKSKKAQTGWSSVERLQVPMNSDRHDVYYILSPDENTAYLASNRKKSNKLTDEACCLDIYRIDKPEVVIVTLDEETRDSINGAQVQLVEISDNEEIKLKILGNHIKLGAKLNTQYMLIGSKDGYVPDTMYVQSAEKLWKNVWAVNLLLKPARVNLVANVFDKISKQPIYGATFRFIDLGLSANTGASSVSNSALSRVVENGNTDRYNLAFGHRYRVIVMKNGFTIDSVEVTTDGMSTSQTIVKNLYLTKGLNLEAKVFDKLTNAPLLGTKMRFYEIQQNLPDEKYNTTGNQYGYSLDFERSYWLVASKEGYYSDSILVKTDSKSIKNIDFQTITKDLYLRPKNLVTFLPLKLYFDNDEPDQKTVSYTTGKTYSESYYAYYSRKEIFLNKIAGGTSQGNTMVAQEMSVFFEDSIKGGFNKLVLFTESLQEQLMKGEKVVITIKGFASPRAADNYNKALTARRITSVKNNFATYKGGVLNQYLKNGQLTIMEEAKGEETSPTYISDQIPDERRSVFSLEASRERRVEIIDAKIKQ